MDPGHPECPARLATVLEHLDETGLGDEVKVYEAGLAERLDLARVHTEPYLDALEQLAPARGLVHVTPDTAMGPGSLDAARAVAGAAVEGVRLVLGGRERRVFCAVRPPGHHAEESAAMGFCFLNGNAIAAMAALEHDEVDRVAILDFDVHHGNGTVAAFMDNPSVLVCSSFQHPHYPYRYFDAEVDEAPFHAADALRAMPGLALTTNGHRASLTQVRVRGAEANHLLVLLDGIALNDPALGSEFNFGALDFAGIQRIEYLAGPQSAVWGSDALAGVLYFDTKPRQNTNRLSLGVWLARHGGCRPRHIGNIDARVAITPSVSASVGVAVSGAALDRDFSTWPATGVELDAYRLWRGKLDIALSSRWKLSLRAENLLDENYATVYGYRSPGVTAMAKVVFNP